MQINGTLYMSVAPSGNIRIKAFETTALGSPVATQDYIAPVNNPLNFTITVPNNVPHIVKVYDSPGVPDGTLLADFLYDPKFSTVEVKADKYYVVDDLNSPADGSTSYTDTDLDGYKWDFERRGVGTLVEGTEWDYDGTDGFKLLKTGDVFHSGETLVIHFHPKITQITPSGGGGGGNFIEGIKTITTDTTLDNTYYNNLISIEATGNKITVTLPAIASTPSNTRFGFITNKGNQINAVVKCNSSDDIFWNNSDNSEMYMGKNEQLWIIKGTTGWYVLNADGGFNDVGKQIFSDIEIVNTIERKGQLLNRNEYPRLFNWYVNNLPAGMIVSEATWNYFSNANKTKFTLGNGSGTFRIPDSRALFIRNNDSGRGIDTGRQVGSYQDSEVEEHDHNIATDGGTGDGIYLRKNKGWGGNSSYNLDDCAGEADTFKTSKYGGDETRPINESKLALICI